jgi:hypothetical protein
MASFSFVFPGDRVALIVRGKTSHRHEPGVLEQHADCILSNGAPIGFYGAGNDGSSGQASSGIGASSKSSASFSNSLGMAMSGVVWDNVALSRKRANYVDLAVARTNKTISTVLFVRVSIKEAKAFDTAWADMATDPGSFQILGWNCSTHASSAFRKAGILSGGIPGLDTPNNLYLQLCREKKHKATYRTGYVGFSPYNSGWLLTVEEQ